MVDNDETYNPHEETLNGKARDSDHTPNSSKIVFRKDTGGMNGRFNLAREKWYAKKFYERHKNEL